MDPPPYDQAVRPSHHQRRLLTPDQVLRAREQTRFDAVESTIERLRASPEYANLHRSIETQLLDPTTKRPRAVVLNPDWNYELRILIKWEYRREGYKVTMTPTRLTISIPRSG